MAGKQIVLARSALKLFVKSLEHGCLFNICSFGSKHKFMFPGCSVPYNDTEVKKALSEIDKFDADMGGTEIYNPMLEIFKLQADRVNSKIQTLIYLLTDGEVSNTEAVLNLVKANCTSYKSRVKLNTFGIGSGADEQLVRGCAVAGCGNFSFIHQPEQIERKVIEQLSKSQIDYLEVREAVILDEDDQILT